MELLKAYYQKILSLLRLRAHAEGLEISDQVLRFVYIEGGVWKREAVRLLPGVLEKGKIKDAAAFYAALRELRAKVPTRGKEKLNVVVALSSVNMYSQVFALPSMEGSDLDRAIDLNVQMLSPMDISQAYYGWQLIGRDEKSLRSEIAAAFADKVIVDGMIQALYAAGFITVGLESRALALVRALREKGGGIDPGRSYLVVDIDNSGIDFLVVRAGKLYFEYPNAWADISDDKGQVLVAKFKEMLAANTRQVLNFYSQHWPEPLAGILLSAVAFEEEAEPAIAGSAMALPVIPLTLTMGEEVPPEWFVAFGCGLRGIHADPKDKEINLSGSGAVDTYHDERLLDFFALWRVLIPVVLGCLIVMYAFANNFLSITASSLESSVAFAGQRNESAEIGALEASSTAFNQSVSLIANAESQINNDYLMITDINATAAANGVTVDNISFQAANTPILVAGTAQSEDQIAAFRNAIQSDPHFGTVTLPLLNIQGTTGAYTFSMTFPLSPSGF